MRRNERKSPLGVTFGVRKGIGVAMLLILIPGAQRAFSSGLPEHSQRSSVMPEFKQATEGAASVSTNAAFQKVTIKGKVLDEKGMGIPGASIQVKGTTYGAPTDIDGNFVLQIPTEKATIIVSFIGYKSQNIEVSSSTQDLTVRMEPDAQKLDEVVVTGFQTLSKERATGAFAKVTNKDLEKYSTGSVSQKLQTSLNGVFVKSDGGIEIRGLSTLNTSGGKADPLIVVDGFPVEGGLSSINPENIESVTLLRDAAAASIYGIRSANGVIVITTKAGSKDKFTVTASADYSITAKPQLSYFDKMNASQAVDLQWEALQKGCFDSIFNTLNDASKTNFTAYSELAGIYNDYNNGDQSALARKATLASYGNLTRKQYEDMLLQSNKTGLYNVSLSGGNKNIQYNVTGRLEDNGSIYKGNSSDKLYLDSRLKVNFTDRFDMTFGYYSQFGSSTNNAPVSTFGYYSNSVPFEPLMLNGALQPLSANSVPINLRSQAQSLGLLQAGIEYNPVRDLQNYDRTGRDRYNRYQFGLEYKWDNGLTADVKYQFENGKSNTDYIYSPETYRQASMINRMAEVSNGLAVYNLDRDKSRLEKSQSDWTSHLVRAMLTYNKTFKDIHRVSLFGGVELQATETKSFGETYASYNPIVGVVFPDLNKLQKGITSWTGQTNITMSLSDNFQYNNTTYTQRNISTFLNGGYTLKDKYNITGSFRIDQSNIFGTGTGARYKPMWSAGASWIISREDFMKDVKWVNNLTLRSTVGLTGMIDKSTSPYIIISKSKNDITGEYAAFPNAPNSDLKWEQTRNFNLGVDYNLFNGKVKGSLDYYHKYTTDVIAPTQSDPTNGFSSIVSNNAEISNQGIDLSVSTLNVNKAVKWTSTLNFSVNRNKIEKVYSNTGLDAYYYVAGTTVAGQVQAGKPIGQIFSYSYAGVDANGVAQVYDHNGSRVSAANSNAKLYKEDLVYSGTSQAPYFGSFNNTVSYKNLTLNVSILYKLGYYSRENLLDQNIFRSKFDRFYLNRWQNAGDESRTNIPGISSNNSQSGLNARYYTYGSSNVFNASHIRLQYVNLAYELPQRFVKRLKLSGVTFRAQAENLGILWRKTKNGIDPDVQGLDAGKTGLPALSTYTLGVNIKL